MLAEKAVCSTRWRSSNGAGGKCEAAVDHPLLVGGCIIPLKIKKRARGKKEGKNRGVERE